MDVSAIFCPHTLGSESQPQNLRVQTDRSECFASSAKNVDASTQTEWKSLDTSTKEHGEESSQPEKEHRHQPKTIKIEPSSKPIKSTTMDPDGDYESRHSIRSTASDNGNPIDDVAPPSKIFAPGENTKLPAKSMKDDDAYDGPTAPPMEDAPPPAVAAAASTNHRSAMEPRGTAYDDMMSGKIGLAATDEAPISNSVAVPIGFNSEDMALPEAKALPIISSTANEGATIPPPTLEEVDVEVDEAQIDEEEQPTPSLPDGIQNSTTTDARVNEGDVNTDGGVKETPTTRSCTRKRMMCCCGIITLCAVLGIIFGVLYGTTQGQLFIKGVPDCDLDDGYWWPDIGDGWCDGFLNTAECSWDGGDCSSKNAWLWQTYPDCKVRIDPDDVDDGFCDNEYNTAMCGWDGGDCIVFNEQYPHCLVDIPYYVGDGDCDGDEYNTAECGWDGGDCLFYKKYNRACTGTIGSTWNDKTREWCQYKCMGEGADCEAYDYRYDTEHCRLFSRYSSTTSNSNRNCWKKK